MGSRSKKLIAGAGFVYGLVLTFYAIGWGVDGPTLTMPLAASPLNVPAAILDTYVQTFSSFMPLLPVLIVVPLVIAPFGWAAMSVFVTAAQDVRRRKVLAALLLSHYVGIAAWFAMMGSDRLLRPFRILLGEGVLLLTFYAAGQLGIWWALLRRRKGESVTAV